MLLTCLPSSWLWNRQILVNGPQDAPCAVHPFLLKTVRTLGLRATALAQSAPQHLAPWPGVPFTGRGQEG